MARKRQSEKDFEEQKKDSNCFIMKLKKDINNYE